MTPEPPMTRQLISTNKQPLLRSPHVKRPPQSGFVQVGISPAIDRSLLARLAVLIHTTF